MHRCLQALLIGVGFLICSASALVFPGVTRAASAWDELVLETRLEQAREESGLKNRPRSRHDVPGGQLRISPSELLAARSGQKIRFSVDLDRHLEDASLYVTLPRRWLRTAESGLPVARPPVARAQAGGRARFGRDGRTVRLSFDGARSTDTASFEVEDVGIPAGTYRLPFSWRDAVGRVTGAGTARVVFYAPVREGPEDDKPWTRLTDPGTQSNVTGDASEESEAFIVTTPNDSDRIAVGINGGTSMSAWITGNRGQTWTKRTLPQSLDAPGESSPEAGSVCCDPMLAADTLGNIWFGGLTFANGAGNPSRIVVNRIAAGTDTFQTVTTGLPVRTSGTQDKPMMTVDNSDTSPTFGRLYVVWNEPSGGGINLVVSQCDTRTLGYPNAARCDNADNWSAPVSVSPATGGYIYADVAVGPDGRVYVTWWDYSATNAIRGDVCNPSTQNCAAASGWGTPTTIATLDATGGNPLPFACPILAQPGGRGSTSPQVDVDRSGGAQNGRVYVSWSDLRPGSGTTRCTDSGSPASTHLTWDSYVTSAANGALPGGAGASESVATRLLTDAESPSASDDWFPWLAVDQTTGQAWGSFYSTRGDATRNTTNYYARSVTPSGGTHTLGTLTAVSSAASDYSDTSPCCLFQDDYGDYTGLDATEGAAFPVWTDNSSGDGEAFTYVGTGASLQLTHQATIVAEGPGADGDDVFEPGESITISEQIRNPSTVAGTGISGTLTTPVSGVTVTQGSSTYPDISAASSGSNTTAFGASIASGTPCSSYVDFHLALTTAQGTESVPFLVFVGCSSPSSPSPSPAADTTAPSVKLGGRTVQRVRRRRALVMTAKCNEPCALVLSGTVRIRGARTRPKLRRIKVSLQANKRKRLRPKFRKQTLIRVRRVLRRRDRVTVRVKATGTDAAGNAKSVRRTIRIKR